MFTDSDFEYLYEVVGVIWDSQTGVPKLNGIELNDNDMLELLKENS